MLYIICKTLFVLFYLLLYRPRIAGYKHLFFKGKAIIVSNHYALADPIDLAFVCPRIIHFMAKQELFENPVLRLIMKSFLTFPVYRTHADMVSLKQAMAVLDKGKVFGIFPEGRRSVTGELDSLEKGAAFLALRCKAPIIPVYADPHSKRRLRVRMNIGAPMDAETIAAAYSGKAVDAVTDAIRDRLQDLKNEMAEWDA